MFVRSGGKDPKARSLVVAVQFRLRGLWLYGLQDAPELRFHLGPPAGRPLGAQVAATIRQLRIEAGMAQTELAARSGLDLRTITRVENLEREPSVSTLVKIARGIGVRPSELLRDLEQ